MTLLCLNVRSAEAIRLQRQKAEYKTLRDQYSSELLASGVVARSTEERGGAGVPRTGQSVPPASLNADRIVGNPPLYATTSLEENRHGESVREIPDGSLSDSSLVEPEPRLPEGRPSGTRADQSVEQPASLRVQQLGGVGQMDTSPAVDSGTVEGTRNSGTHPEWVEALMNVLREGANLQGLEEIVPGQSCSQNQKVVDMNFAELERIIPACPKVKTNQPENPGGRDGSSRRRSRKGRPKKVKFSRPISRRKRRQILYRRLQQAWKRNQSKTIRSVLDGTWKAESSEVTMAEQLAYWKPLLETEGVKDPRTPTPVREPVMTLLEPITKSELELALASADANKASGPDGRSLVALRKAPVGALLQQLNLWLVSSALPTQLHDCVTTLIPKEIGTSDPSKFRPITVSSWLVRIYHKILAKRLSNSCPVSDRQKAFREGDGLSENVNILKHLLKDRSNAKAKTKAPLCLAFIDVRKAFDTVSPEALENACHRAGVPSPIVQYIRGVYSSNSTRLTVGGELSASISCRRGVKQGDPLSCFLFNLVMDWCLGALDPNLGVKMGEEGILNHLAFADDTAIITESEAALDHQVTAVVKDLALCGLRVNAAKCSTIRISVRGVKTRTTWVNPEPFLRIDGQLVSSLGVDDLYKYLGVYFSPRGTFNTVSKKLGEAMKELTAAPLKGFQRLEALKSNVVPSLYHQLVLSDCSIGLLDELDRRIRKAVRTWLHLPPDTTNAYMYAPVSSGGMGIVSLAKEIPLLKIRRLQSLAQSSDGIVQVVCRSETYKGEVGKWRKLLTGNDSFAIDIDGLKSSIQYEWASALHETLDGKGLKHTARSTVLCGQYPRHVGSAWLAQPGRFTGEARMFNQMVALRGSTLETGARRGRGSQGGSPYCEACLRGTSRVPDSLSHRLQSCIKTNGYLTTRHNKIVSLLAGYLRKRGAEVQIEPMIRVKVPGTGETTFRKPDLVIRQPNRLVSKFWVIDVTIVADAGCVEDPDKPHHDKVNYYSVYPEVEDYAVNCQTPGGGSGLVRFSALVFNWRGIPAPRSCRDMSELGISKHFLEFLSRVVVEQGVHLYRLSRQCNVALPPDHPRPQGC